MVETWILNANQESSEKHRPYDFLNKSQIALIIREKTDKFDLTKIRNFCS